MAKKGNGEGSIRKLKNGRYEGRITTGYDPATGRQIQKSFTGATKNEVIRKMSAYQADIDNDTYIDPSKMTVGQWLDTWTTDYITNVTPRTLDSYEYACRVHLKPALGAIKLQALTTNQIQTLYTKLQREKRLSSKTIKNFHGALHRALEQAKKLSLIRRNPSEACILPRVEKKEMVILSEDSIADFLEAIEGHPFETIFFVDLFTGMRQGEILGLTWDAVDFKSGVILIGKQLQKGRKKDGIYRLVKPKNDKVRKIMPGDSVMEKLQEHRAKQTEMQLLVGSEWKNPFNLVFTNEFGGNLSPSNIYKQYKRIVTSIGIPEARFHDLRHSYAVVALQAGNSIKAVQENLGHHTAAFTLDVYGHYTDDMKKDDAKRMDRQIEKARKKG